jgi:hypothetical protein
MNEKGRVTGSTLRECNKTICPTRSPSCPEPNTCVADIFTRSENYQDEDTYQNYCQHKRSGTANNVLPCNTHDCVSGRFLRVRYMHNAKCGLQGRLGRSTDPGRKQAAHG